MYFHLGGDTMISDDQVIGVFDMDTTTVSAKTREFLARAEKQGRVEYATSELPKSFILCGGKTPRVIISQLNPVTLKKRAQKIVDNNLI